MILELELNLFRVIQLHFCFCKKSLKLLFCSFSFCVMKIILIRSVFRFFHLIKLNSQLIVKIVTHLFVYFKFCDRSLFWILNLLIFLIRSFFNQNRHFFFKQFSSKSKLIGSHQHFFSLLCLYFF